jgi:hypothetical protein
LIYPFFPANLYTGERSKLLFFKKVSFPGEEVKNLEFDFKEAFSRIGFNVVQETNKKLNEIMQSEADMEVSRKTNLVLNEMINDNIRVTLGVLEEYHMALMKYLDEKDS